MKLWRHQLLRLMAVALVCGAAACMEDIDLGSRPGSGADASQQPDTARDSTPEAPSPEQGSPDTPPQPDITPAPDQALVCTLTKYKGKIGRRCLNSKDCAGGQYCLGNAPGGGGICTVHCTPDNPATPLTNEDNCPGQPTHSCHKLALAGGGVAFGCARTCNPAITNDCDTGVSCRKTGGGTLPWSAKHYCLYGLPACAKNSDCRVTTGQKCLVATANCPIGQVCLPHTPGSANGLCYIPGSCDAKCGFCAPRPAGKPAARVGDPCLGDTDCAGALDMTCLHEVGQTKDLGMVPAGAACKKADDCCSGKCLMGKCAVGLPCITLRRNGYCAARNCKPTMLVSLELCPAGSHCNLKIAGGVCLKSCDLQKAGTCRGHAKDLYGDYECRDWSGVTKGGAPLAAGPTCDFGHDTRCDYFLGTAQDCTVLGGAANPTKMACRDQAGKVLTFKYDPLGLCLDNTPPAP